jgi:hypothetical protein
LDESGYIRLHPLGFLVVLLSAFPVLHLVHAVCDVFSFGSLQQPGLLRLRGSSRKDQIHGGVGAGGGEGLKEPDLRRSISTRRQGLL